MSIPRNRLVGVGHFSRVKLAGPQAYPLHDHEFGEIFWVDEGRCRHHVNGHDISLSRGSLVFIRPWDRHSFHGVSRRPFFIDLVCFDWRIFQYLQKRYFPRQHHVYGEKGPYPKMLQLGERQLQKARGLFLTHFNRKADLLSVECFLLNVVAAFCPRGLGDEPHAPPAALPEWMAQAWKQIHEAEHFRLGAAEFCRLSGRSREHVSREFRKATGGTLGGYVNRLRMRHAAFLLEASSMEVVDIALECGLESLSHFYRCFREAYGATPQAYRLRAQGRMYSDPGEPVAEARRGALITKPQKNVTIQEERWRSFP